MNYQLTVSAQQAGVISAALEVYARLGIGQVDVALERLPLQAAPVDWHETMIAVRALLAEHLVNGIDGYRASLSMCGEQAAPAAKTAWDLYQVIRRRLAWDRAVARGIVSSDTDRRLWPEMMSVDYDDPLPVSGEPLAVITGAP